MFIISIFVLFISEDAPMNKIVWKNEVGLDLIMGSLQDFFSLLFQLM